MKWHNPNQSKIPDHPYKILIIGGSGSEKKLLVNLVNHKLYTDEIYLYGKDPWKAEYQFLINKCKGAGLKHCNDYKSFIEYSNDTDVIYQNIEEYNPNNLRKILIAFNDVVVDMFCNKKLRPKVTELFIKGRKLKFFLVFIT